MANKELLRDSYLQLLNNKCNMAILLIENKINRTLTEDEMRIAKAAFVIGLNSEDYIK